MKISYRWLSEFIELDWKPEQVGDLLTDLGLEVEGITPFSAIPGGLEGVVVGHVLKCEPHPNADRLKLTQVDVGHEKPLQIVCGAPNVEKGQKVPVALVGTTLYDKDETPWKIKKGKIRGQTSEGMICAEDELHLGNSHDGILVLDAKLKPGTLLKEVFKVEQDWVYEIGLTPNRADAMSHWGVARDLKAGLAQQDIQAELITPSASAFHVDARANRIQIEVADQAKAPRYCGLTMAELTVKASPDWLQNRLKAIGLNPINNVVDATNYILHHLGQPLHAFDAKKIEGDTIFVKTLAKETSFTTLDGVTRKLHEDDLMICDTKKPLCIAGVFGGETSGVTEQTTSIFLESAFFDPISVRKTAKRHGLNTDASFRFERGIDPHATKYALRIAALLIQKIAGGKITSDIEEFYPKKIENKQVVLNFDKVTRLIGKEIPREQIKRILTSLEIKVNHVTETNLGLTIPAYRNDVTREVDVIEEILRVYGYQNIPEKTKLDAALVYPSTKDAHKIQDKVSNTLASLGFYEILNNSLTNPDFDIKTGLHPQESQVEMLNPLSTDLKVLRQSMLYGGLQTLLHNINRKANNLALFEFGKTYHKQENSYQEYNHLALFIAKPQKEALWLPQPEINNFFWGKGVISTLLNQLGFTNITQKKHAELPFQEGLTFLVNNQEIVQYGVLDKNIAQMFDIDTTVFYADWNWDLLLKQLSQSVQKVTPLPKFPKVTRDLALLVSNAISFNDLETIAYKTEKKLLRSVVLFDVYTGKNLPKDSKSYALRFTLQDDNKTLNDKQIDKIMKRLQNAFEKEVHAQIR